MTLFRTKYFHFGTIVQQWEAVECRIQNFLGFAYMDRYILSWELINTKNYFNVNHHAGTVTNWPECKPEGSTISLFGKQESTPYKGIQDSLGFWIPHRGFRIPGTGFQYLSVELGFWIPIVTGIANSLSCNSGFQSPGFRIPQAKFFRILDSTSKNLPDSLT